MVLGTLFLGYIGLPRSCPKKCQGESPGNPLELGQQQLAQRCRQLVPIRFYECVPSVWLVAEPGPQLIGGPKLLHPGVEIGRVFGDSARPPAIYQDACPISRIRLLVDTLDRYSHFVFRHGIRSCLSRLSRLSPGPLWFPYPSVDWSRHLALAAGWPAI